MIIQRVFSLQTLTLRLPRMQTLNESTLTTLTQAKLLRKLDIGGYMTFEQLAAVLTGNPLLRDLEVTFMRPLPPVPAPTTVSAAVAAPAAIIAAPVAASARAMAPAPRPHPTLYAVAPALHAAQAVHNHGHHHGLHVHLHGPHHGFFSMLVPTSAPAAGPIPVPAPVALAVATALMEMSAPEHVPEPETGAAVPLPGPFMVTGSLGKMHLTSITLSHCQLDNLELMELFSASGKEVRVLSLSHIKGMTRLGFKNALKTVGSDLRVLVLEKLTFTMAPAQDALPNLAHLLDDLPTDCPRLEELTIASTKICSEQNFLTTVIPALFLTQLALDYTTATVTAQTVLNMIAHLPAGRMETLSFGQEMSHLSTPEVYRACDEIGIVLLGSVCI